MNDSHPREAPEPDAALDALLRQAAPAEPDAAAVERLRGQWRRLVADRRRRRFRQWTAAAAAVVLGLGTWLFWPRVPREDVAVEPDTRPLNPAPSAPRDQSAAGSDSAAARPHATDEFVWSRPATAWHELVVARSERRQRSRAEKDTQSTPRAPSPPADDVLETAIQTLLADPAADVARLAEPLLPERASHERRLLERLPAAPLSEQRALIALLGRVGSPRSVPALLHFSADQELHALALRAVAPHAHPILLADLARRESDRAVQRDLLRELAARPQPESLAVFLDLVADPGTREPALAALGSVSQPPLELLFSSLNGADSSQQLAAALVLGRLNGPEITHRLIRQALSNVHRQPALLALVASPGDEARHFVQRAERDQSLFAAVYSARLQFQLLLPPRGSRS